MKCEEVKESIEAFHDGAASAVLQTRMEKHIAICSLCKDGFDHLQSLKNLLQKDIVPIPSVALDRRLMQAFIEKHAAPAKSSMWLDWLFAGSVRVPKPAFAAALIAVVVAITTANLIGRNASISSGVNTVPTATLASLEPQSPKVVEKTKIVEVPIVKERVITKIVYLEQKNSNLNRTLIKSSDSNLTRTNSVNKRRNTPARFAPNLQMSASVAENGYFTRTNLSDFEPATESNIRIIRREKADEK
jgi:hypothetical protein